MMADFVQGNLDPIAAKVDKLSELDTVSGFSLEMSYSRNVRQPSRPISRQPPDPLATYNSQGQLAARMRRLRPSHPASPKFLQSSRRRMPTTRPRPWPSNWPRCKIPSSICSAPLRRIFDKHRQQVEKSNPNDASAPALIDRMHDDLLAKMSNAQTAQPQEEEATAAA